MLRKTFIPDLLAGLTVSFAAISLGAAFGTMSGRGAFAGMIAAAVIPIIASVFGGTRLQASGPTAPMTAVSALVVAYAYEAFPEKALAEQFITLVLLLTAAIMIIGGIVRLARFIEMVPNVVILGFMNGIAVLIWWDQIKKLFAIEEGAKVMDGGILINTVIALAAFALIFFIPWFLKKINMPHKVRIFLPGVLVTIILLTVVTTITGMDVEHVSLGTSVESLREYLEMLTGYLPGAEMFQWKWIKEALPYAGQIALLGYLDSLLTALVVDKMTREKSNLNKELVAQGLANTGAALFQGIPGAQATIRSVLLIKEGAQTRLAGVLIGVFALLGILVFKDYLVLVASAVFVGVLFKAGADVFDRDFLKYYFKRKWHGKRERNIQLAFIAYTTLVTVIFDLNIAVISGTILFYVGKYLFKIRDAESDFEKISAEESETITG